MRHARYLGSLAARAALPWAVLLALAAALLAACSSSGGGGDESAAVPPPPAKLPKVANARLAAINDWCYVIQGPDLPAIAASRYDLAVIDYAADGTQARAFGAADIAALKNSTGGKIVLAYLSIGEAEDYRFYWGLVGGSPGANWSTAPPFWLGPENPDWPGNFKVRYWDPVWQAVIVHNPGGHPVIGDQPSYLDRILEAGFDGVFLDVVDAFEFWGPPGDGGNGERPGAAADMARLLTAISQHARSRDPEFIVCQQNGEALLSPDLVHPLGALDRQAVLDAVDMLSVEDVFYRGDRDENNRYDPDGWRIGEIDRYRLEGKLVTAIDYFDASKPGYVPAAVDDFYARTLARGWVTYAGPRALDRLVLVAGHEPD